MQGPGMPVPKALRDSSPAALLVKQFAERVSRLHDLTVQLEDIYTRLHGPRPQAETADNLKVPVQDGFFPQLERHAEDLGRLLEAAQQRATQIAEALHLG